MGKVEIGVAVSVQLTRYDNRSITVFRLHCFDHLGQSQDLRRGVVDPIGEQLIAEVFHCTSVSVCAPLRSTDSQRSHANVAA